MTGGSGLLGQSVQRVFGQTEHELWVPAHSQMDITDASSVQTYMDHVHPDVVIHCAAYSQVDRAEREPHVCRAINVLGTKNVADACRLNHAYILYISTDYVFNGEKPGFYVPGDEKAPLSVYGITKSEGEDIVLASSTKNCVLRTSWLFGSGKCNFVDTMLRLGKTHDEINVVDDQVGSPTWSEDLARLIQTICEQQIPGILHGTNENTCSWAEFAREIFARTRCSCRVNSIPSEEYPSAAVRPKNSRLSKDHLDQLQLSHLPRWEDALQAYLDAR